ncbi:MAG: ribosomal L7Ae/L30e/S12e/Gadd45 family protein [Clostridia bacterium]|nr:ribosomal L7Ae/L30e/S12e/Gadd45 family protein [Clostridia bacterium]
MKIAQSYSEQDILKFLGLAQRASKVVSGNDMLLDEVARGNIKLLIIAKDVSKNTLDKFLSTVAKFDKEIPAYRFADKESLGNAIGKPDRALVGLTDDGFAKKLEIMLDRFDNKEEQN